MFTYISFFVLLILFILILLFVTASSVNLGHNTSVNSDVSLRTAYLELTIVSVLCWLLILITIIGLVIYREKLIKNQKNNESSFTFLTIILIVLILILGVISADAARNMVVSSNFNRNIPTNESAYVDAILAAVFALAPLIITVLIYIYNKVK